MVSVRELFSASFECAALLVYFFVALSVSVLGRQIFAGILRGILILVGNGELAAAAAAGPDAASAASTEAQITRLVGSACDTFVLTLLILVRLAWRFDTRPTVVANRLCRRKGCRISPFARKLLAYNVATFLAMVLWQAATGNWFMSLANLQVSGQGEAASLDYSTVFRMYVQAPVTEELLFRLCMLYFAYSACWNFEVSAIISNLFFGVVHILNASSRRYASGYVLFQTSVGFLIGHAFSLRLAATGSLTEVIVLHMVNNICASFVPSDGSVNLLEPSKLIPLLHTVLVYSYIIWRTRSEVAQLTMRDVHKLHPVLAWDWRVCKDGDSAGRDDDGNPIDDKPDQEGEEEEADQNQQAGGSNSGSVATQRRMYRTAAAQSKLE